MILPCHNDATFIQIGQQGAGNFILTNSTKLYRGGFPKALGQWVIGLAGSDYYCLVSTAPQIVYTGVYITDMGSSN